MIMNNAAAAFEAAREDAREAEKRATLQAGPTPGEIGRAKWFSVNTIKVYFTRQFFPRRRSMQHVQRYSAKLTGISSLLIHADNVLAADDLMRWRKDPKNKNASVAGDDRSPAWAWTTYLYSDGKSLCMLADAVMVALRFAGSKMTMKKQESFKAATQSGILIDQEYLPIITPKGLVTVDKISRLKDLPFEEQAAAVETLGLKLDVRRAVVGTSKHVRVRPRFDSWSLQFSFEVTEPAITLEVLAQLFDIAGQRSGIGDWRPSAKKSGTFGRFVTELKPE